MFTHNKGLHPDNTRNAQQLCIPKYKSLIISNSLKVTAVKIWSYVCNEIDPNLEKNYKVPKLEIYSQTIILSYINKSHVVMSPIVLPCTLVGICSVLTS